MRRIVTLLWLLGALGACGSSKDKDAPVARKLTAAEALADAREDTNQRVLSLCTVIHEFPDAPEAAQAKKLLGEMLARARTSLAAKATERHVRREIVAFLQARIRAAADDPCANRIGVSVARTYGPDLSRVQFPGQDMDNIATLVNREWPAGTPKLGVAMTYGFAELTDGWASSFATGERGGDMHFELHVINSGVAQVGDHFLVPVLAVEPTMSLLMPGRHEVEKVALDRLEIDPAGVISYRKDQRQGRALDNLESAKLAALRSEADKLADAVSGLVGKLGLRAHGDPALRSFAGTYEIDDIQPGANECDLYLGPDRRGDPVEIDAIARTITLNSSRYHASVEADAVVATEIQRDPECQSRGVIKFRATWRNDRLQVEVRATGRQDCKKDCVGSQTLLLEPTGGTLPLSKRHPPNDPSREVGPSR